MTETLTHTQTDTQSFRLYDNYYNSMILYRLWDRIKYEIWYSCNFYFNWNLLTIYSHLYINTFIHLYKQPYIIYLNGWFSSCSIYVSRFKNSFFLSFFRLCCIKMCVLLHLLKYTLLLSLCFYHSLQNQVVWRISSADRQDIISSSVFSNQEENELVCFLKYSNEGNWIGYENGICYV